MVNQLLKGGVKLQTIVQFIAGGVVVIPALGIADPFAFFQRRQAIKGRVDFGQCRRSPGVFENDVAIEIKEKVIQCAWLSRFHMVGCSYAINCELAKPGSSDRIA